MLRRKTTPAASTSHSPAAKKKIRRSPSGKGPDKTRQAFALFRLLLALPMPMFLLFTGIQYSRRDRFAGWTGSFTELDAGRSLSIQFLWAFTPVYCISLFLAQIHDADEANTHTKDVWTWPTKFEFALFLVAVYTYCALYFRDRWIYYIYISVFCAIFLYFVTKVVRGVKVNKGHKKYTSFVLTQAARVGINIMIIVCKKRVDLAATYR